MYTPNRVTLYNYKPFSPASASNPAHQVTVNVTSHGYPAGAVALELLVGCRTWDDGAYVAAYDGTQPSADRIAVYTTAQIRNAWTFGRGRVELSNSSFLLRIRPIGEPIEVLVVMKGYYTA